jgi:hypothetical protein
MAVKGHYDQNNLPFVKSILPRHPRASQAKSCKNLTRIYIYIYIYIYANSRIDKRLRHKNFFKNFKKFSRNQHISLHPFCNSSHLCTYSPAHVPTRPNAPCTIRTCDPQYSIRNSLYQLPTMNYELRTTNSPASRTSPNSTF